jgi:4-hydroxybenzoate polyprenyltransferase
VDVTERHVNESTSAGDGGDREQASREDARPAVARVGAFLVERFPPIPQLVLMAVLFIAATTMPGILLAPAIGGELGDIEPLPVLAGFVASLLFIVRLRLYDDVKDAETDRVENPTRPIPRGLVTVRELDVAAAIVLVVEGVLMLAVGPLTAWCWAIAAAWSVLMRVEFLAPRWLDRHVTAFAVSHMVVLGLIFASLLGIGIEARGGSASLAELFGDRVVLLVLLAATSIGVGFEWGRKFERYHVARGERAWTLWMLWPSVGVLLLLAQVRDDYPLWSVLALVVVAMGTIFFHALIMGQRDRSGATPTGKLREAVELAPGATGLLTYVILAAAGIVELVA